LLHDIIERGNSIDRFLCQIVRQTVQGDTYSLQEQTRPARRQIEIWQTRKLLDMTEEKGEA